jgi:predicted phosphodiesterase
MDLTWGLISDVHGNRPALERAIVLLRAAGAERFAFLGDYLGRGDSDACARLIQQVADVAVVGNRDLDWQHRVAPETREWVLSLPRLACSNGLLFAHGDSRLTRDVSTADIARGLARAWVAMEQYAATVLAFGHSHHARVWRKQSREQPPELLVSGEASLEPGWKYVVNVGSAGLPFPGKGGPSVALIDFRNQRVRHLPLQ